MSAPTARRGPGGAPRAPQSGFAAVDTPHGSPVVRYVEGRTGVPVAASASLSGLRRRAFVLLDVMHGDVAEAVDALAWGGNPAADALVEQAGSRARARDALMEAVRERADTREVG